MISWPQIPAIPLCRPPLGYPFYPEVESIFPSLFSWAGFVISVDEQIVAEVIWSELQRPSRFCLHSFGMLLKCKEAYWKERANHQPEPTTSHVSEASQAQPALS